MAQPATSGPAEALRDLYEQAMRRQAQPPGPDWRVDRLDDVTRLIGPDDDDPDGAILWSALDVATADAVIAREIAYFRGLGQSIEWRVHEGDTPPDLGARLVAAGFAEGASTSILAAGLDDPPWARGAPPALPEGVGVFRVREAAGLAPLDGLIGAVDPEGGAVDAAALVEEMAEELEAAPEALSVYLAMAGEAAIAAGWLRHHAGTGMAELAGGMTHPAWRGRGLWRVLVALRGQEAREAGCRFVIAETPPEGRAALLRLGFLEIAGLRAYRLAA